MRPIAVSSSISSNFSFIIFLLHSPYYGKTIFSELYTFFIITLERIRTLYKGGGYRFHRSSFLPAWAIRQFCGAIRHFNRAILHFYRSIRYFNQAIRHFAAPIRYLTELSATFAVLSTTVLAILHFAAPIHYFNRAILHFAGSIRYILHFYPIKKECTVIVHSLAN